MRACVFAMMKVRVTASDEDEDDLIGQDVRVDNDSIDNERELSTSRTMMIDDSDEMNEGNDGDDIEKNNEDERSKPVKLLGELLNVLKRSEKMNLIECELSQWRETEIIAFLVDRIRKECDLQRANNSSVRVGRVFTCVNEGGFAVLIGEETKDKQRSINEVFSINNSSRASTTTPASKNENNSTILPKIAIATLESPVNLGASDGRNARVVCLVLVPPMMENHSRQSLEMILNDINENASTASVLTGLDRWNKIACIKAAFRSLARETDFVSDASDFKRMHSHVKKYSRFDVFSAVMHGDSTDDKVRLMQAKQRVIDAWEQAVDVLRISQRNSYLHEAKNKSNNEKKKKKKSEEGNYNAHYEPTRSHKFCGGIVEDIKRRSVVYASDWTDGLRTMKTITATLYMYFGCLGPAIAFGGLAYEETNGKIGAMEFLLCQSFVGITWAILGGQPELVLRPAGPQTVFMIELYRLSTTKAFNVPFELAMAWTGIWTSLFMLTIACFDLCAIVVRSCTRFTQEIFMVFVSAIFIFEGCRGVGKYFDSDKETYSRDVALFSLILASVTLQLGLFFGKVRSSPFLLGPLRELTADFGIAFAIVTACLLGWGSGIDGYEKLSIPSKIEPSDITRKQWLIDLLPSRGDQWIIGGAIFPAICLTCLYYIDANVAALLCNKEESKLKKGTAYHYDFAILSILLFVCSIFGLPFATPSLPHSPQYVRALSEVEEITQNGVTRTKVVTVHEQRLSPLLVNVLVLLSFVLLSLLKEIPMPVLYGLFVLMGINGFYENQFFHRLTMIFMEPRLHPPTSYVRNVPLSRVYGFTFVQVCCVAIIWGIRSTELCIMFPVFILMLMPLRFFLSKFDGMFTREQLKLLDVNDEAYIVVDDDGDDNDEDENNDENEENGDNTILAASNESEAIIVRAAQKAALFDSRAITLMDFAENGPSLNVSSLTSGKEPPSPSAAASGGTYKFPYKSPFRTAKKENRVRIHRRSSSYFSEEDSDNRPISPTSPSPRYQAPASPRF